MDVQVLVLEWLLNANQHTSSIISVVTMLGIGWSLALADC